MKNAVAAVKAGTTLRSGAIQFSIPWTTLVSNFKKSALNDSLAPNYKHSMLFTSEQENLFALYLENCSKMFHGLTLSNERSLAYEMVIVNKTKILKAWHGKKSVRKEWLLGLKLHPPLFFRQTESTSLARATTFNPQNVNIFFVNL